MPTTTQKYIYPPRAITATPPHTWGILQQGNWLAQPKLNDTHILIDLDVNQTGIVVTIWDRHKTQIKHDTTNLHPNITNYLKHYQNTHNTGYGRYLFDGGLSLFRPKMTEYHNLPDRDNLETDPPVITCHIIPGPYHTGNNCWKLQINHTTNTISIHNNPNYRECYTAYIDYGWGEDLAIPGGKPTYYTLRILQLADLEQLHQDLQNTELEHILPLIQEQIEHRYTDKLLRHDDYYYTHLPETYYDPNLTHSEPSHNHIITKRISQPSRAKRSTRNKKPFSNRKP